MFTRVFNVAGLIARLAEWKSMLALYATRRSAMAVGGYFAAATLAALGLCVLLGAGYIAIVEFVGPAIALGAIGALLLLIATVVALVARRHGRTPENGITEASTREKVARGEKLLLSMLGFSDADNDAQKQRAQVRDETPSNTSLNDPKVMLAAGFAVLGLLGPGRVFRTIRIASAIGSVVALANRAVVDSRNAQKDTEPPESPRTRSAARSGRDVSPGGEQRNASGNQQRPKTTPPSSDNTIPSHNRLGASSR